MERMERMEISYNYDEIYGIPESDKQTMKSHTSLIRSRINDVTQNIVLIGKSLRTIRELLPHGEWGKWLDAEFSWSERQAQNFMNIDAKFGDKSAIIADLSPTVLGLLSAPSTPEEARTEVLDEARSEKITVARAKEIINGHKNGHKPKSAAIDGIVEPLPGVDLPPRTAKDFSSTPPKSTETDPYGPFNPETDGGCNDSICPGGQCEGCDRFLILESRRGKGSDEDDRLIGMMISLLENLLAKANGLGGDVIFPSYSFSEGKIEGCWEILTDQILICQDDQ